MLAEFTPTPTFASLRSTLPTASRGEGSKHPRRLLDLFRRDLRFSGPRLL